jgi:hypothetical protein
MEKKAGRERVGRERREAHLEHTRLRVLSTTPKQTRRFNPEVAHLLGPPIQQTRLVLVLELIPLGLGRLLLRRRHLLLLRLFPFEVVVDRGEVAEVVGGDFGAVGLRPGKGERKGDGNTVSSGMGRGREGRNETNRRVLLQDALPVMEEVLDERRVLDVVGLEDGGEEGGDFFGFGREGHGLPVVLHLDVVSFVFGREEDAGMFEGFPL